MPPGLYRNITVTFGNYRCTEDKQLAIKLEAFESAELESLQDLTGLRVKSNQPIVVLIAETSERKLADGTKLLDSSQGQLEPSKHWKS